MDVGLVLPMGDKPGTGVPSSYGDISRLALDVEAAGLDSVWVFDHLLIVRGRQPADRHVGGVDVLAALAATTTPSAWARW